MMATFKSCIHGSHRTARLSPGVPSSPRQGAAPAEPPATRPLNPGLLTLRSPRLALADATFSFSEKLAARLGLEPAGSCGPIWLHGDA